MSSSEVVGLQSDSSSPRIVRSDKRAVRPGLDKRHGFFLAVWSNQINRDEFHKCQEQRKTYIKQKLDRRSTDEVVSNSGNRENNLYVPPALRKHNSTNSVKTLDIEQPKSRASSVFQFSDNDNFNKLEPESNDMNTNMNKTSPKFEIIENQNKKEKSIREGVRRRYMRTAADVDDLCVSLANSSIQNNEKEDMRPIEEICLFRLQLTLKNGDNVAIDVSRGTQAARLAKTLSREHEFNDDQCRKLRVFIDSELEKRKSL